MRRRAAETRSDDESISMESWHISFFNESFLVTLLTKAQRRGPPVYTLLDERESCRKIKRLRSAWEGIPSCI